MSATAGRGNGSKRQSASTHAERPRSAPVRAPLTVTRKELLVDGADRDFRALVHGLLTFQALHAAIRDGYASVLELGGPQYTILLCIRSLAGVEPVNVRNVAERLRLSASFVTVETTALQRRGLVSKERGAADRRMVSLALTAKGTRLLDSIAELRQQVNDVEFGCLTRAEFRMLVPLVERLIGSGKQALALLDYLRTHRREAAALRAAAPS